jgi:hypothetical protein
MAKDNNPLIEYKNPISDAVQVIAQALEDEKQMTIAVQKTMSDTLLTFANSIKNLTPDATKLFSETVASVSKEKEVKSDENIVNVFDLTIYLPMGDLKIKDYNEKLQKTIVVNLHGEQYQFAYLATHLLFMTYMYSVVWRTSRLNYPRYIDSLTFLKGYGKDGVNFSTVNSVFDYHQIHEGDTFEFLKIVDVDNGFIQNAKELIKTRNDMAHANGNFKVGTQEDYADELKNIIGIVEEINEKFTPHIKSWYEKQLLDFMNRSEDKIDDFVDNLISIENLSIKELEMCSKYGLSKIKNRRNYPNFTVQQIKLVEKLHKNVKEKYKLLANN